MAWITQIRVANSKTVSPRQYESAKAEREFIISFAPGELKTTDEAAINVYCRDMGTLVSLAVDEGIGLPSEVREPSTKSAPPRNVEPPKGQEFALDHEGNPLKDKFGNVWPKTVTCKECGTVVEVRENSFGGPMAICDGTKEQPHGGSCFLKYDGSVGKAVNANKKP